MKRSMSKSESKKKQKEKDEEVPVEEVGRSLIQSLSQRTIPFRFTPPMIGNMPISAMNNASKNFSD